MAPEKLDRAKIEGELAELQLEETRERVHQMRSRNEGRRRRAEARNLTLLRQQDKDKERHAGCWHKKGGKGVEALSRGTDSHFAVVKHQLAHGPIIVVCQRCGCVWEPPPRELNRPKATAEQKAEYRRLYDEYVVALNFQTDNEMSGSQLFNVTYEEAA
jgi:hypothetical protein